MNPHSEQDIRLSLAGLREEAADLERRLSELRRRSQAGEHAGPPRRPRPARAPSAASQWTASQTGGSQTGANPNGAGHNAAGHNAASRNGASRNGASRNGAGRPVPDQTAADARAAGLTAVRLTAESQRPAGRRAWRGHSEGPPAVEAPSHAAGAWKEAGEHAPVYDWAADDWAADDSAGDDWTGDDAAGHGAAAADFAGDAGAAGEWAAGNWTADGSAGDNSVDGNSAGDDAAADDWAGDDWAGDDSAADEWAHDDSAADDWAADDWAADDWAGAGGPGVRRAGGTRVRGAAGSGGVSSPTADMQAQVRWTAADHPVVTLDDLPVPPEQVAATATAATAAPARRGRFADGPAGPRPPVAGDEYAGPDGGAGDLATPRAAAGTPDPAGPGHAGGAGDRDAIEERTDTLVSQGRPSAYYRGWSRGRKLAIAAGAVLAVVILLVIVFSGGSASWPASVAVMQGEAARACQNPDVKSEPGQVDFACAKSTRQVLWVFALLTSGGNPGFTDPRTGRQGLEPITRAQGGALAWSLNLHHPYDPANPIDSMQVAARAINNIIGGATVTGAGGNPVVQPGLEGNAANCLRYTGSAALTTRSGFPAVCARPVSGTAGQAALVADVFQRWIVDAPPSVAQDAAVLFANARNPGDPQVQAILKRLQHQHG